MLRASPLLMVSENSLKAKLGENRLRHRDNGIRKWYDAGNQNRRQAMALCSIIRARIICSILEMKAALNSLRSFIMKEAACRDERKKYWR